MTTLRQFASLVLVAALGLGGAQAGAQVRIGQPSGFTGPEAPSVAENNVDEQQKQEQVNY